VVATIMSNLALDHKIAELGGKVIRANVGDRYVVGEMRKHGYRFGGEQSGHLVYLDHSTTGDGMLAALKLLTVLRRENQPMSTLKKLLVPYPQALINVAVKKKAPLESLPAVQKQMRDVERELGQDGRLMVRFSGTEPKVRVLVEGPKQKMVDTLAKQVAQALKAALG
jgi:phosphoglucosamine mutase